MLAPFILVGLVANLANPATSTIIPALPWLVSLSKWGSTLTSDDLSLTCTSWMTGAPCAVFLTGVTVLFNLLHGCVGCGETSSWIPPLTVRFKGDTGSAKEPLEWFKIVLGGWVDKGDTFSWLHPLMERFNGDTGSLNALQPSVSMGDLLGLSDIFCNYTQKNTPITKIIKNGSYLSKWRAWLVPRRCLVPTRMAHILKIPAILHHRQPCTQRNIFGSHWLLNVQTLVARANMNFSENKYHTLQILLVSTEAPLFHKFLHHSHASPSSPSLLRLAPPPKKFKACCRFTLWHLSGKVL